MAGKFSVIPGDFINSHNRNRKKRLDRDISAISATLKNRGIDPEKLVRLAARFSVAVPSWGMATGGTRFGSFPVPGQPRDVFEKIDDAAALHCLTRMNPRVSLHVPWDKTGDYQALKNHAGKRGLGFDAMNSNTFEDQPGQKHSYKFGSLSHVERRVRDQAVAHHFEVISIGRKLGSRALSIWVGDGSNFPGQVSFRDAFDRYLESLKTIYKRLPPDWTMYIEYKPFEPAFYHTVLADWGSALFASQQVGPRCRVLVDLGHHLPGTNIEAVVAMLISAGKLGGFHFNDKQYADDDLTAGSIDPYRLFRVFHELAAARKDLGAGFQPAYLIDQSHNLKDPIEALIQTSVELQDAWVKANCVSMSALRKYQKHNDVLMAEAELKRAFNIDVRPITALARLRSGGAIDPVAAFRDSGYRMQKARERGG